MNLVMDDYSFNRSCTILCVGLEFIYGMAFILKAALSETFKMGGFISFA